MQAPRARLPKDRIVTIAPICVTRVNIEDVKASLLGFGLPKLRLQIAYIQTSHQRSAISTDAASERNRQYFRTLAFDHVGFFYNPIEQLPSASSQPCNDQNSQQITWNRQNVKQSQSTVLLVLILASNSGSILELQTW